ncbi:MAG: class I SAM-dependent methyltransferase [Deltaproteobacteria bacterium]|jgi:SAM-dependent methyltransferase|nr:class I SAM-dependent methyltransferase [Deltaproteobacteria bacterium]
MAPRALNPYESDELLAAFPEGLRPGGLALTQEALDFCQFPAQAPLVDVGCGTGVTLGYLKQKGFQVLGLDKSDKLLRLARQRGSAQKASFESLPLAAETVAGLFCECSLSLAQDKAQVLGELWRCARPGGFLIISDLVSRTPRISPEPGSSQPLTCAAGAVSLKTLARLLAETGWRLRYYRDHQKALKSLAASLVWRYGSLANLGRLWPGEAVGCLGGSNLTYGLFIAQKSASGPRPLPELIGYNQDFILNS